MNLGTKLEQILEENNITQNQMAKDLAVDKNTISKWKSNAFSPSAYYIKKICVTYNKSADWLLGIGEKNGRN